MLQSKPSATNESLALQRRLRGEKIFSLYRKYGIVLVFLLIFVLSALCSPNFLKVQNLVNIVRQNATITILACGMNILIISGFIDLSGGLVLAMSGCFAAGVMAALGRQSRGV